VVQSSGLAHTGQTLQRLERERVDAQARVHQLEAEVAALSSQDRIEQAARDRLGMTPPRKIEYVEVGVAAPQGPLLPRPVVAPQSGTERSSPWWRSALRAIRLF
jgi:cell division protein FtsL